MVRFSVGLISRVRVYVGYRDHRFLLFKLIRHRAFVPLNVFIMLEDSNHNLQHELMILDVPSFRCVVFLRVSDVLFDISGGNSMLGS